MLSTKKEGAVDKDHTCYAKKKKTQKAIYCMIPLMKVRKKTELWKWRRKISGCQELEEGLETEAA